MTYDELVMYDELAKKIRQCATDPMHCLSCGEDKDGRCFKRLMTQAADAIEKLQKVANKLLAKYEEEATSVIWEYSGNIGKDIDRLNEEVRTLMMQINGMPMPAPPEEKT